MAAPSIRSGPAAQGCAGGGLVLSCRISSIHVGAVPMSSIRLGRWVGPWIATSVAALGLAGACNRSAIGDSSESACAAGDEACGKSCPDECDECSPTCNEACLPSKCRGSCGADQDRCGGECVNLASDPKHCGRCERACAEGEFCVEGKCSTTCTGTVCGGDGRSVCVELSSDRAHCGACNRACDEGSTCVDSKCVEGCSDDSACNGACVDLKSDEDNCGKCGAACPAGGSCTDGECRCPAEQKICGDSCVDTAVEAEHCGECGQACDAGERCEGGRCVGEGQAGGGGCDGAPVANLSLSEVAVYQSVKISIMRDLSPIERAKRNADVVQGRDAVFRIHVAPGSGWTPREVAARIELTAAGSSAPQLFFSRMTPSAASRDDAPESTFQIKVPGSALAADTQYAVSLVECARGTSAGTPQGARFPSDGFAPLEARETGLLRVHLVPISSGGAAPELPDSLLTIYRKRLLAIYPATAVELTVGEPLKSSGTSMCAHLSAITSRRSADNAPVDMYYHGLTPGVSGGQSGCGNLVSSASSRSKISAGWSVSSGANKEERGASTMSHELGHVHGRSHAPCGVQDPDRNFPYTQANIGVYAYDSRSETFLPPTRKDMMSYCPNPDRSLAWVSDYTYKGLVERVAAVNALARRSLLLKSQPKARWRLLVVDSQGSHWGEYPLLVEGTPDGTALPAIVHGRDGFVQSVEVYKEDLDDGIGPDAYMLTIPEPNSSWHAIEVPGLLAPQVF